MTSPLDGNEQSLDIKWDPQAVEVHTKSIQQALEPLVNKVTALMNTNGDSGLKKGKSKNAHVLSLAIERATAEFIEKAEQIAKENPFVENDLMKALDEVKATGDRMRVVTTDFCEDPLSVNVRKHLVTASRELLSAVTRLLIIADMVDVHVLLKSLKIVRDDLDTMKKASSQQELYSKFQTFGEGMMDLDSKAYHRQIDLRDPQQRDDMASARATMKKNSMMLFTASKAYISNRNAPEAKNNRDFAFEQMENAVNTIGKVTTSKPSGKPKAKDSPGFLAAAMDDFDRRCVMETVSYKDSVSRPALEKRLETIISSAAHMADRPHTRDERRERIVNDCNGVRQALQDLLTSYEKNAGKPDRSLELDTNLGKTKKKSKDLRRQLRRAVVDHVSDSYAQTDVPILMMFETAKQGNGKLFPDFAAVFEEHTKKLIEVAELCCSMSSDIEGVKLVRYSIRELESLYPQVINAAKFLSHSPRNKLANENMDVFKSAWETQMRILTTAVDNLLTIDDFLSVSESHILDDVNKCVFALQDCESEELDKTAAVVRGRANRICQVVTQEMESLPRNTTYNDEVMQAVYAFRDNIMPHYSKVVENAIESLAVNKNGTMDENEFIDACRWVYDGVREIRRCVLVNRAFDEIDSDSDYEEQEAAEQRSRANSYAHTPGSGSQRGRLDSNSKTHTSSGTWQVSNGGNVDTLSQPRSRTASMTENQMLSQMSQQQLQQSIDDNQVNRAMMRSLPEEEKQQIAAEVAVFKQEKAKLDAEITKWDETGNDIITLAKQMCIIMMEMTDFTRGRGPLKTTMDVIGAAQNISQLGKTMVELAGEIVEQCVQSRTKVDLQNYLKNIVLYTHQLNITSKVKTDITQIGGEMVLSGLESAISLISSAKNLMQAVVQTVKAAYVASTKYRSGNNSTVAVVVWKMRAPEKKPLIRPIMQEEINGAVRKESKYVVHPVRELGEFR